MLAMFLGVNPIECQDQGGHFGEEFSSSPEAIHDRSLLSGRVNPWASRDRSFIENEVAGGARVRTIGALVLEFSPVYPQRAGSLPGFETLRLVVGFSRLTVFTAAVRLGRSAT